MKIKNIFTSFTCFIFLSLMTVVYAAPIYTTTNGSKIDFANKWVIINYWASWCDTCIEEIPELNKFHLNNKTSNVILIGIEYDQLNSSELLQAIRITGVQFPVLTSDVKDYYHLPDVVGLPTTFIINPQGRMVKAFIGPSTEKSLWKIVHELQRKT